ncbi:hypothetical protein ACFQV2_08705 [Actinokineospora soli]|uniref:Secreted protein n=1 Tax=Actinokineospora soli TaxID=1048753 RepID=A0ABW2TIT3_9PSEU
MRNLVRRAAAVIAVVGGTMAWTGAAPAVADPWEMVVLKSSEGKWKASLWYHDADNEVCIRAHNSISSAYAETWVRDDWYEVILHFRDYGGNDEPTCRTVSSVYDGAVGLVYLQHRDSDGHRTDSWEGHVTF